MQHLIGLMDELCRPMPLHGMPDPAQAEQEQQGEDQDRGHPPTRIWRKASAYCEGGKRKVPAPRPAETCAEEHLADRIGIERRTGRSGHIGGGREHRAQRRYQGNDCANGRYAPRPGIECR